MIEAESQAVLNTLTEHDFQDAFKNGRSTGATSGEMVARRPKVTFNQMVAPVSEIMEIIPPRILAEVIIFKSHSKYGCFKYRIILIENCVNEDVAVELIASEALP
jgi:hypothetical protein